LDFFRHTFCTLLYLAGVDVLTAMKQMGHADIKTTMQIYTHLDAKYQRKAMNKLDDYLNNASSMQLVDSEER
jgi:integrase